MFVNTYDVYLPVCMLCMFEWVCLTSRLLINISTGSYWTTLNRCTEMAKQEQWQKRIEVSVLRWLNMSHVFIWLFCPTQVWRAPYWNILDWLYAVTHDNEEWGAEVCLYTVLIIPTPAQPRTRPALILTLVPVMATWLSRGQTSGPEPQGTRARHAGHVTHVLVITSVDSVD